MKKLIFRILPLALVASLFTSCQTYGPNANASGVIGGVLGAGIGAALGEHKGRELEGAAIGGTLGVLAGGALGNAQDQAAYGYGRTTSYPVQQAPVVYQSTPTVYNTGGYYGSPSPYYRSSPRISIGGHFGSYRSQRSHRGYGHSRSYCAPQPQICY